MSDYQDDYQPTIETEVEIQKNGIIRDTDGYLIGNLINDLSYNQVKQSSKLHDFLNTLVEKYKIESNELLYVDNDDINEEERTLNRIELLAEIIRAGAKQLGRTKFH